MSAAADQADRFKAGTLPKDPAAETRVVGEPKPRVLSVDEVLAASMVNALRTDPAGKGPCTTGHYKLDQITGGLKPTFSWLIGADTSWGKSSFLIMIADENLRANRRVLIVSSEDSEELYGDRLMVRRSRVNALRYRDRKLTPDEMGAVTATAARAESVPVYVDAKGWKLEKLAPHIRTIIREERIDVVAFDYIQEFESEKRYQDERIKFKSMARIMRNLGKEAKITTLIFSQLTLSDDTKQPTRANIRECKDIAHGSEVILIGYEPGSDIVDKTTREVTAKAGDKVIYVDKVKNGPKRLRVVMPWNEECACFETQRLESREERYGD